MEGMDGGRVGETTPGSEKKKKKKAWWRRRPKMKKKGVAVPSRGAPGGSGGESDMSLKNRAGAIEPASSVSSPLAASRAHRLRREQRLARVGPDRRIHHRRGSR